MARLLTQCEKHNTFEFLFKIEYWGILWMPWFIYIADESLKFSANDISENDLKRLIKNGHIEFIEEIAPIDTIDLEIKKYRIKNQN
ncbi:hypothetical protein [Flavobacterium pectinovorum]|uniref:hypothetical protein n=1 Tax=Flavobacterium pectinovorum TaxID=29533 RepID=UPI00112C75FD|nr:hypothetical protein [Flavobacterium pectinovorum]